MFAAFSKSQWNWTWRFLLLGCASVLVFLLSGLLSGLFHTQGGVTYYMAALSLAGFVVDVIGALVSFVTIMLRRPIQRCER